MKINWKVRIKNKVFWCTVIPGLLLLVKQVLEIFGIVIDITALSDKLEDAINTLFYVLAVCGILIDPTTPGGQDSDLAMTYEHDQEEFDNMGKGDEDEQQ